MHVGAISVADARSRKRLACFFPFFKQVFSIHPNTVPKSEYDFFWSIYWAGIKFHNSTVVLDLIMGKTFELNPPE